MATTVRLAPLQIDYLNLIRAGAAEIVLIGHASGYCLAGLERDGHLETFGVLIFFLLSGFCRIFCGYVPALIFVVAVDASVQALPGYPYRDSNSVLTWIGNLAMLQEYPVFQVLRRLGVAEQPWFIEAFGSGRPFWTVAIEWWIYLGFGSLMFRIVRPRRFGAGEAVILSA